MVALPQGAATAALNLLYPPEDPYLTDPVAYAADVLGFHAWSKQREVMESVRDHDRTAVKACHGVGKTAGAAQIALWFLGTHPNSRVITTAPTWAQVEQLLWREIRAAVARAHSQGKATIFPRPSATKLEIGDQWFAIGLSTNEPERFQGHHADHILLIVDEASGVDEKIYEAAEGFLTAQGAKVLLISNPTKIGGQFHRCFTAERDTWNTISIAVTDSPNYTGEKVPAAVARSLPHTDWFDEKAAQWGLDSPMFQVRVLGNFPTGGEDTVISLSTVEAAQLRDLGPQDSTQVRVIVGCDVARYGSDETVIAVRVGQQIRIVERYVGKSTVHTAGRVAHWARQHPEPHVSIVVDDTGVGGGVTDQLRAEHWPVTAFNGGEKPHHPLEFPNRRSELWFQGAAQLEDIDLDGDDQLAADLTSPKYTYDLKMRRVVERKDETKKRLGRSPDRADAVLLTFVQPSGQGALVLPARQSARRGRGAASKTLSDQDWFDKQF